MTNTPQINRPMMTDTAPAVSSARKTEPKSASTIASRMPAPANTTTPSISVAPTRRHQPASTQGAATGVPNADGAGGPPAPGGGGVV
jgi:hypothetical protein